MYELVLEAREVSAQIQERISGLSHKKVEPYSASNGTKQVFEGAYVLQQNGHIRFFAESELALEGSFQALDITSLFSRERIARI